MHLTVVVSDLPTLDESPGEGAAAPPAMPMLEALLRQADRARLAGDWRDFLLESWAAGAGAGRPSPAGVAAAAVDVLAGTGRPVWLAQPVHLLATVDHVRMHAAGMLRLHDEEAARLAEDFARVFAGDGLQLHPLQGRFVLSGLGVEGADPGDPAPLAGSRIDARQRGGTRELRRLASETELWLHEHPVNQARARRGELAVTALWLWGGGQASSPAAGGDDTPSITGEDPFVAGLARLSGAGFAALGPGQLAALPPAFHPPRAHLLQVSAAMRWRDREPVLSRLDRELFAPLLARAKEGGVSQLDMLIGRLHARWRPAHRRRFWRRTRPWWEHPRR